MVNQQILSVVLLCTEMAIMRLHSKVTSCVIDKVAPWCELLLAPFMLTLIRLLPCMSPQMNPKVSFLVKDFAASSMRADKSERNSCMFILQMYFEPTNPSELFSTLTALKSFSLQLGVGIFDFFWLVRKLGRRLTLGIAKIQLFSRG